MWRVEGGKNGGKRVRRDSRFSLWKREEGRGREEGDEGGKREGRGRGEGGA
jgi:hypothetical protein